MKTSKVVEVDGIFVGAAVALPGAEGWRFVSTDDRARQADGCTGPTFQEVQSLARRALVAARAEPVRMERVLTPAA